MTTNLYTLRKLQTSFPSKMITSSVNATEFIRQFFSDDIEIFESMFMLMLNNSNTTIGFAKISQGGVTGTVADVRIIAKYAVDTLATGVILCHNHPSGTLTPSHADKRTTKRVKEALEILDIKLLDHIIITADSYHSMADNGEL